MNMRIMCQEGSKNKPTDVLKVGRAILTGVLDHDSAAARVVIQIPCHIIDGPVDEQPAVFGRSMLC